MENNTCFCSTKFAVYEKNYNFSIEVVTLIHFSAKPEASTRVGFIYLQFVDVGPSNRIIQAECLPLETGTNVGFEKYDFTKQSVYFVMG